MIYVPIHGCANVEWKHFELSWVFHLNILLLKGRWSCLYGSSNQLWGGTLWKWPLSGSYLEWKSKCESLILKIIQHEEEARKVAVWPRVWLSWHQPPSLLPGSRSSNTSFIQFLHTSSRLGSICSSNTSFIQFSRTHLTFRLAAGCIFSQLIDLGL